VTERVGHLSGRLAAVEQVRLAGMPNRDQARSRAHAYGLLRQVQGSAPESAPISYAADGRPAMPALPVDISIAHRADRVAVALVASPGRVGIDLEDLDAAIDAEAFMAHALTGHDNVALQSLMSQGWTRSAALIGLWSAKEACCKCTGYPLRPRDLAIEAWHLDGRLGCRPGARMQDYLQQHALSVPGLQARRRGRWLTVLALSNIGHR